MHAEDGVGLVVLVEIERLELQRIELARDFSKFFQRLLARHVVAGLVGQLQQHFGVIDLGSETADHVEQALVAGETLTDRPCLVGVVP